MRRTRLFQFGDAGQSRATANTDRLRNQYSLRVPIRHHKIDRAGHKWNVEGGQQRGSDLSAERSRTETSRTIDQLELVWTIGSSQSVNRRQVMASRVNSTLHLTMLTRILIELV